MKLLLRAKGIYTISASIAHSFLLEAFPGTSPTVEQVQNFIHNERARKTNHDTDLVLLKKFLAK